MLETQLHPSSASGLTQLLDLWLEALEARCCSPKTIANYRLCVGKFVEFLASTKPGCTPESVTPSDIRRWIISRRGVNSTHTLNNEFRNPRAFWNWLLREELTENNPFAKVEPPKKDKIIKPDLDVDEVTRLLNACSGKSGQMLRDRALINLILDTGLRAHEVHNLRVGDVQNEVLIIRGKGGKHRYAFLSPEVRLTMQRYLRAQAKELSLDSPLWRGHRGPLTLSGLKQAVRDIGERAGVPHVGPHRLRRTFATWCLRSGCDIETLRRLMGHSSLSVLQGYLALVETDLKNAHDQHSPIRKLPVSNRR